MRNGKAGGGHQGSDVEVIVVRDGMLAETPNGEKSLDDRSEGLGMGQVRIVGRFFRNRAGHSD